MGGRWRRWARVCVGGVHESPPAINSFFFLFGVDTRARACILPPSTHPERNPMTYRILSDYEADRGAEYLNALKDEYERLLADTESDEMASMFRRAILECDHALSA